MQEIIYQNRIPKDFFITKGAGDSNLALHAGSYHLALKAADIEKYNIITYSSILPKESTEVKKPDNLIFGSVLETIMAVANGTQGQKISAGIAVGWLKDKFTDEIIGGLVCEHAGFVGLETLKRRLMASLSEIFLNSFHDDYTLNNIKLTTIEHEVTKKYGTALVSLCFINHIYRQEQ